MEMRGQFYSLMAVLIIIPLVLFMAFFLAGAREARFGVTERVIADQEHQVASFTEDDLSRALSISGRRALLAAVNDVVINGQALDDSGAVLEELVLDGTLNGNESFIMTGNTLDDWRDSILGVRTGFDVSVEHYGFGLYGAGGFRVAFGSWVDVNVSDSLGISRIDRSVWKESHAYVTGLEDPLYTLNTEGFIQRVITEYPYPYYALKAAEGASSGNCSGNVTFDAGSPDSGKILVTGNASGISGFAGVVSETGDLPSVPCYIVSAPGAVEGINSTVQSGYWGIYLDEATGGAWSIPLLEGLAEGHYYPESGPDLLLRLEGNLTGIPEGMESFVRIPDLQAEGIPVKSGQSLVDYLYFAEQNYNGEGVRGFPGWFRIDTAHAAVYGLTELLES